MARRDLERAISIREAERRKGKAPGLVVPATHRDYSADKEPGQLTMFPLEQFPAYTREVALGDVVWSLTRQERKPLLDWLRAGGWEAFCFRSVYAARQASYRLMLEELVTFRRQGRGYHTYNASDPYDWRAKAIKKHVRVVATEFVVARDTLRACSTRS